jgi:hypothetical protein
LALVQSACSHAQSTKEEKMKATFQKLVTYFQSNDTSNIRALFETENNPAYSIESEVLLKDCKLFSRIVQKYGLPQADSIKLTKGEGQENVVYATLMNKTDSSLNLKLFEFGVLFYPDRFLKNPEKILTYQFHELPVIIPEKKFIPIPKLKNNR